MFDYSVRFRAIDEISNRIASINARMAEMAARAARAAREMGRAISGFGDRARTATDDAARGVREISRAVTTESARINTAADDAMRAVRRRRGRLEISDRIFNPFNQSAARGSFDALRNHVSNVSERIVQEMDRINRRVGSVITTITLRVNNGQAIAAIRRVEQGMRRVGRAGRDAAQGGVHNLLYGFGLVAAAVQPLEVFRKYELAFKDVKKAVAGTPEQIAKVRDAMKEFKGATFEELAKVYSESGKMGFDASNVSEFANQILKGAKALDFSAEVAVEQIGKILSMTNQMDTAVESSAAIMDKIVQMENKLANVKADKVIDIWARSADTFSQLNFDNDKMASMSAFLAQTFNSSELGASGFKMMINRFKRLEGSLGFVERIKTGGFEGIRDVMSEISKLSPEQRIKTFGNEAMILIDKMLNSENMLKLDVALELSKSSAGAVNEEWRIFRETLDERIKDSQKNISNAMEEIGMTMEKTAKTFLGYVDKITLRIRGWIKENKKLMSSIVKWSLIIGGVLAAFGVLAILFGIIGMVVGVLGNILFIFTARWGLYNLAVWRSAAGNHWLSNSFGFLKAAMSKIWLAAKTAALWLWTYATRAASFSMGVLRRAGMAMRAAFIAIRTTIIAGSVAVWAFNAALLANPITWIVAAIIVLVAVVIGLIYYWDEIVAGVKRLWQAFTEIELVKKIMESFGQFVEGVFNVMMIPISLYIEAWKKVFNVIGQVWDKIGGFQGLVDMIKSGFDLILDPIKTAIGWIDKFLSKFQIFTDAKNSVSGIGDSITNAADEGVNWVKGLVGADTGDSSDVNSGAKHHYRVDVNVKAESGTFANSVAQGPGDIRLNTVGNGI